MTNPFDLTGRTAAMLVELPAETTPRGWRLAERPGRDLRRAQSLLARDLDALEEVAEGFVGVMKISACGPWTLAAALELNRSQEPVLADRGAVSDLTASLAEGVAAHVAEVAARVPGAQLLLQLDEPALPAVLAGSVPMASGLNRVGAVDRTVTIEGLRSVLATCAEAKKKNLSLVSGLCYRYEHAKRETMKRVHDGQIGDVVALHCSYNTGALWHKPRQSGWTDMEWQLRNWLYFTWLSGDHIVEQAIHSLDKMAWAMKDEPPLKAVGTGGRQARTGPEFGHIFDHFAVVYQYKSGVKLFHYCRQQAGTKGDVSDHVLGTEGT